MTRFTRCLGITYKLNPEKDVSLQAAGAVSCALADLYVELYGIDAYERLIARSELRELSK